MGSDLSVSDHCLSFYFTKSSPRNHKGNKAETMQKCLLDQPLKNGVLLLLVVCFHCYGNLKFPLASNGKKGKLAYCYLTVEILINVLQKCFRFSNCCHGNWKAKMLTQRFYSCLLWWASVAHGPLVLCVCVCVCVCVCFVLVYPKSIIKPRIGQH